MYWHIRRFLHPHLLSGLSCSVTPHTSYHTPSHLITLLPFGQRNLGIEYVRRLDPHRSSKAYFADDDNAYATELFDEIAKVDTSNVLRCSASNRYT